MPLNKETKPNDAATFQDTNIGILRNWFWDLRNSFGYFVEKIVDLSIYPIPLYKQYMT